MGYGTCFHTKQVGAGWRLLPRGRFGPVSQGFNGLLAWVRCDIARWRGFISESAASGVVQMQTDPQDDLVIVTALVRLSYQFEAADPALADRAWRLAIVVAGQHGLTPRDAVRQLD